MATHSISGNVVYPPGPWAAGVVGATVEIIDADSGGNGNDVIFGPVEITDTDGSFSGTTREWVDTNTESAPTPLGTVTSTVPDMAAFSAVVRQGAYVAVYPLPLLLDPLPPLVVYWQPDLTSTIPSNTNPGDPWGNPVTSIFCKTTTGQARDRYKWKQYDFAKLGYCEVAPPDATPPEVSFITPRAAVTLQSEYNETATAIEFNGQTFGDELVDFEKMYPQLPEKPAVLSADNYYKNDEEFAAQRLIGPSPAMIKRIKELPDDFPVTNQQIEPFLYGTTLQQALDDKRMFILDYDILKDIKRNIGSRYLPCPYALFVTPPDRSKLMPVAIQIERGADPVSNPIYTPKSKKEHWSRAKLMVQVADVSAHELQYHLFNSHMTMEVVAVAMYRNLCQLHPISVLLHRHFTALLWTNEIARSSLINEGGPVDQLIGTGIEGSKTIIREAHKRWRFDYAGLPADLKIRGFGDPATSLTNYPYRDDGLLVWNAIENYMEEFVSAKYATDHSVNDDPEIKNWVKDIVHKDRGNLNGLSEIKTRKDLISFLTTTVFTCSAYHSAVNYPQYDYIGYVPNMPGASWARPLPPPRGTNEERELEFLPPQDEAAAQVQVVWNLAGYQYDRLGHYRNPIAPGDLLPFSDPQLETTAGEFRTKLNQVATQIENNNSNRSLKYMRLHPKFILNSISV